MKLRVLLAALFTLVTACTTASDDYSEDSDDLDDFALSDDPAVSPDRGDDPDPAPDVDAVGTDFAGVSRASVTVPGATSLAKFTDASADPDAAAATTRTSRAIPITGVKQHDPVWCVPASGRTILSAFMDSPPAQATLATRMHTGEFGTAMDGVSAVLNHYEDRNTYILSTVNDVDNLLNIVHYNVRFKKAPMMAALEGGELPDWAAHGFYGYHAIVLYGWIKDGPDNWIKTWDPLHVPWTGAHAFRARVVQRALNAQESLVVW